MASDSGGTHPQQNRLRLQVSAAAAAAAEYLAAIVPTTGDGDNEPGEMITWSRRVRVHGLRLLDYSVLCELARGTSWETIATKLNWPLDAVHARYDALWKQAEAGEELLWPAIDGAAAVPPLEETAADLDAWYRRVAGDKARPDAVSGGLE